MYLLSALHGHGTSSTPSVERHADRVQAGHELAVLAERVEGGLAHAGHDPHRDGDVGRVGAAARRCGSCPSPAGPSRRARRTSCGPPSQPREEVVERLAHLRRVAPVVGRAGVVLALGADEGAVLDAGDVARVRQRQVGVGALGLREPLEGPGVDELLREAVVLLRRAVAPVDRVGLRELRDLARPRPAASRSSSGRSSGSLGQVNSSGGVGTRACSNGKAGIVPERNGSR